MGRKKEKGKNGGEEQKKKDKSSGQSGCGSRAHNASQWNGEKALKNAVLANGFLEAFLIALDAEDAGLHGLSVFQKLETRHCAGHQLVEHGRELAVGKKTATAHHRTQAVWEDGPSAWMTAAKKTFVSKVNYRYREVNPEKMLLDIGERYDKFAQAPGGDISAAYRRMDSVAKKLDELKLPGSVMLEKLETEAIEGNRSWLFQSMEAADKRRQAVEAKRNAEAAEKKAAEKAAAERAKVGK